MMPDISQLERALVNADKAGDVQAARALATEIQRQRGAMSAAPAQQQPTAIDPSEGGTNFRPFGIDTGLQMPQGVSRFLAGAGKSIVDLGRGAGQMMGLVDRSEIDQVNQRDKALMETGAGTVGGIAGGAAMALPAVLAGPAAATIGAQGALGALQGALQPVGTNQSRLGNMAVGGAVGAAVPAAVRAAKVLRAGLVDPFTDAGRNKIVGGAINRAASDPQAAKEAMTAAAGATPGFNPTAGQAANDAGVASLERTARAIDPAGFGDIDMQQRSALIDALRGIAKTPEDRAAAVAEVEKNAKKLYGEAFKENVEVTPALTRLTSRKSVQAAEQRAIDLANEMGIPFNARLKDMRPQSVSMPSRYAEPSLALGEPPPFNSLGNLHPPSPTEISVPGGRIPGSEYMTIPPVDSVPVRDMHTLKMGMDALLSDPTMGIAGREAAAVKATRNKLLDQLPESYQVARQSHIEMNKPVNQMDIGQELYNRFVPALADNAAVPFRSRAQSFADALRNGDKLAANVTGLKSAKLDKIMTPEQMAALKGVLSDSQAIAAAQDIGRGVGSDTVQKMAMSNLIEQAGLPSWIGALAPLKPLGGWAQTAGNLLYKSNDEKMRHLLADALKDPRRAAEAMQAAGVTPSQYAELLSKLGATANQALPAAAVQGN